VAASRHPDVREGERIYGYLPMATHVVLEPGGPRGARFLDGTAHRQELPRVYNEYTLIDRDAGYDSTHENEHLVLRPLFALSFFCAEFLKEQRCFGARQVILSSASSKTALGLAFLLAQARAQGAGIDGVEIVGLTSPGNAGFVAKRGVCDRVVAYGEIAGLPAEPAVFIDIAGDGAVRAAVHGHLRDALRHSALVGFTHWDTLGAAQPNLPGPAPKLFFTPDHVLQRRKEWGGELLGARLSQAWRAFVAYVQPWLGIEHTSGRARVERVPRSAGRQSATRQGARAVDSGVTGHGGGNAAAGGP
jgi:hypothetical protein